MVDYDGQGLVNIKGRLVSLLLLATRDGQRGLRGW